MRVKIWSTLALSAALVLGAAPAYAYHGDERSRCGGYDDGNGSSACSDYGGQGNHNRRREDYNGAGCKYVCPSFDKSPVHDAFNFAPFICMPGATCYQKDPKDHGDSQSGDDQGSPPPSQQRTATPCVINLPFHCDPKPN